MLFQRHNVVFSLVVGSGFSHVRLSLSLSFLSLCLSLSFFSISLSLSFFSISLSLSIFLFYLSVSLSGLMTDLSLWIRASAK